MPVIRIGAYISVLHPFFMASLHIASYVITLHRISRLRIFAMVSFLYVNVSSTVFTEYSSLLPLIPDFEIRSDNILKKSLLISGKHVFNLYTAIAISSSEAGALPNTEIS